MSNDNKFEWDDRAVEAFRDTGLTIDDFKSKWHKCKYCNAWTTQSDDRCYAKPQEQRIEVEFDFMFPYGEHKGGGAYHLSLSKIIPEKELPLLKQAIEKYLNHPDAYYDWEFRYTKEQVDSMCENAYTMGQASTIGKSVIDKWPSYQDFKQSKQQP